MSKWYTNEESRKRHAESTARYYARKRGEAAPLQRKGVAFGYRQSPEHRAKRAKALRRGPDHHFWKGDEAVPNNGRARARRAVPECIPCEECSAMPTERHHVDGNVFNNDPANIRLLCRRCHMRVDGRLDRLVEFQWRKRKT